MQYLRIQFKDFTQTSDEKSRAAVLHGSGMKRVGNIGDIFGNIVVCLICPSFTWNSTLQLSNTRNNEIAQGLGNKPK